MKHWMPLGISLAVIALDRFTKVWIRLRLRDFDSISIIPGWFRLIHTENPGAAFGILANGNPIVRSAVLIGVSLVVLVFVAAALLNPRGSFGSMATRVGLGFILGGAIGNLFDRIVSGTVTDFLEVYNGAWSFPAFNVADSAITVGAVLLLIDLLLPRRRKVAAAAPPGAD